MAGVSFFSVFSVFSVFRFFLFFSFFGFFLPRCYTSAAQARRLSQDPFFTYVDIGYELLEPQEVLESLKKKEGSPRRFHNEAVAQLRFLSEENQSWKNAQKIWQETIRKYPKFLAPYLSLSRLYFLLQKKKSLLQLHENLTESQAVPWAVLYRTADELFYRKGRLQEGLILMKALENNKNCSPQESCFYSASFWLGEYYFAEPNYTRAYYYYKRALAKKPNDQPALWGIARLSYLSRQWGEAASYMEEIQKKSDGKTPPNLSYFLANSYFQERKVQKALQQIKRVQRSRHNYKSLALYGDILLTQNFQSDLSFLLRQAKGDRLRNSLLRYWYGVENIKGLGRIHSSFFL